MLSTQAAFLEENIFFNSNETMLNSSLNISPLVYSSPPTRLGSALGASVAFLFIVFGIFGDTLIILAILSKRELRNNLVNIFIVSLQLNDLFNIGFNQFLVGLSYLFMKWHGPYIICEMFVYTSIICTGTLLWHHALIAIHRYLVVVCNLNITYFKAAPKFYVLVSIIIARLIPTLVCIPALISRNMTVYSQAALRCMLAPGVSGIQNLLIVLINMILPCLIVLFCFAHIFAKVHTVSKKISKNNPKMSLGGKTSSQHAMEIITNHTAKSSPATTPMNGAYKVSIGGGGATKPNSAPSSFYVSIASMHREIQISKMFAIIFTVFLFGYIPYGIIRLIDSKNNLNPDVYVMLTVLFIISISVSPIIYGLMNKQIKMQCVILLRHLCQCCISKFGGKKCQKNLLTKPNNNNTLNDSPIHLNNHNNNYEKYQFSPSEHHQPHPEPPNSLKLVTENYHNKDDDNLVEKEGLLYQSSPQIYNDAVENNQQKMSSDLRKKSNQSLTKEFILRKEFVSLSSESRSQPSSSQPKENSSSGGFLSNLLKSISYKSLSKQQQQTSCSIDQSTAHSNNTEKLINNNTTNCSPNLTCHQPQSSESLNISKLLIEAEDDGGVYKGPPS